MSKGKKVIWKWNVRIIIEAFENKIVDEAVKKICLTTRNAWVNVSGPIPLPTKIEKITLNRSTFVNKDAREQFEIRRHRRLIDLKDVNQDVLTVLQGMTVPTGVGINIKVG